MSRTCRWWWNALIALLTRQRLGWRPALAVLGGSELG